MEVLKNIVFQLAIFIVLIYVVGYVISLINRTFYKLTGGGRAVCYATGFIGTPIHELAHASMCLVFFHKIAEIKLFQIDDSGVLGYVSHNYNRKNIYQVIGNYFIGVAPIIVGAFVLLLVLKLLLPDAFTLSKDYIAEFISVQGANIGENIVSDLFNVVKGVIVAIFTAEFSWKMIVFFIVSLCIALHMSLSGADIKGSLGALPFLIILVVALNYILSIFPSVYAGFYGGIVTASCFLIAVLAISLIFSCMVLVIGIIVSLIRKIF